MRRFAPLALLCLSGCYGPGAISPPARHLPLESSAALARGLHSVQVAGNYGGGVADFAGISARVRNGIGGGVEVQSELGYRYGGSWSDQVAPHWATTRFGVKHAVIPEIAFVGGLGGGVGPFGGFVTPDLGVIFAGENPYFVPWVALRTNVSVPIAPRTIEIVWDEMDQELSVGTTLGFSISLGFRASISIDRERGSSFDILLGTGFEPFFMFEPRFNGAYRWNLELGMELVF
jgi:hypothetical protein